MANGHYSAATRPAARNRHPGDGRTGNGCLARTVTAGGPVGIVRARYREDGARVRGTHRRRAAPAGPNAAGCVRGVLPAPRRGAAPVLRPADVRPGGRGGADRGDVRGGPRGVPAVPAARSGSGGVAVWDRTASAGALLPEGRGGRPGPRTAGAAGAGGLGPGLRADRGAHGLRPGPPGGGRRVLPAVGRAA